MRFCEYPKKAFYRYEFPKYSYLIIFLSKKIISIYPFTPLTWEDLFNVASVESYNIFLKFDEKFNIKFQTFLYHKINFFLRIYCKKFTSKNQQIMNFYLPFIDEINSWEDAVFANELDNSYFSNLSLKEINILKLRFLDKMSVNDISKKTFISSQKINKIISNSKDKIIDFHFD